MRFLLYPYLAFHDIEGYILDDDWVPKAGMTVIDAGACRGEYSIYASLRVGSTGKVVLLEPDPENIEMAKRNIELNGSPSNIQIVPAALWKEPGRLSFVSGATDTSAVASLGNDPHRSVTTIEVQAESLESLLKVCSLMTIDIVKMDIEGAEIEAVDGAFQLPSDIRPRFSIASYHVVDGKKAAEYLPDQFDRLNYLCVTGNPRHLTTYATPIR